jgi:proline dehydrogenase
MSKIYHASLYGFINNETDKLIKADIKTYKYLPYGSMDDAIPYLSRRLEENPQVIKYLF